MKKRFLPIFIIAACLFSLPALSQSKEDTTAMLGLPGDNLDLYAVLTLFQKSKTIEAFEQSLNDEKEGINNLDLDLNKKVDFIKVVTKQEGDSYAFILQVDVTKTETQDVAVILLNKDKNKKVSLQIVGDEALYGKDYVIEPKGNSKSTPNPAYTGADSVKVSVAPSTTVVVVESAPIVQYVYSPAYVPYYPPYYYGYYPPYFAFATCVAVGIYRSNHYYYHAGYYGGHYGGGNTVIINNGSKNTINHYNNSRNVSNTVSNNSAKGSYGSGSANQQGSRPSAGTQPANKGLGSSGARPSNPSTSNRPTASTRDAGGGLGSSGANRASSNYSPSVNSGSRNFSGNSGGGGRNMSGGGMSRGGGGGRRR